MHSVAGCPFAQKPSVEEKSMLRILTVAILILAGTTGAQGMTIDAAVTAALEQNPELQTLRLEDETARAQLKKTKLPLIANPVIEGAGSKKEKPPEEGSGRFTNYGFKLSQEFEIAGQRGVRIDVAKKNLERVAYEIRDRERTLVYEVRDAFIRALASKERAALAKEVVRLQEELLAFTKIKYQAGAVSGLEVNLAEVELSKAKRDLLSAGRESREAILALQGVMGAGAGNGFSVEGELFLETVSMPDKESLKERAAQLRPDIKATSLEVDRTKRALDLVKREAVPNLTLAGFFDRDEGKNEVGATLSVSIPLFDSKQAERKEAMVKASQAKIRRAALEKTVEREIDEAYSNLTASLEELSLFKKEIISKSSENLGLLSLAYREGKIGFFEVTVAQKETLEIQFAYLETMVRARRAVHAIERAMGGEMK
jgi:cobalt-zinc-cadmium efflux system outer membrane protein